MVRSWVPALLVMQAASQEDEQTGIEIVQRQREENKL